LIFELERLDPVVRYGLLLRHNNIFEVIDDLFLNLQVDLEFNILQLKYMILNDHLKKIAIAPKLDFLGNIVTDFFCTRHRFH
jgi:hypothetical protein